MPRLGLRPSENSHLALVVAYRDFDFWTLDHHFVGPSKVLDEQ